MIGILDYSMIDELEEAHLKLDGLGIPRCEDQNADIGGGMEFALQVRMEKALMAAKREGIEAAAKVCDEKAAGIAAAISKEWNSGHVAGQREAAEQCAAAIRALVTP